MAEDLLDLLALYALVDDDQLFNSELVAVRLEVGAADLLWPARGKVPACLFLALQVIHGDRAVPARGPHVACLHLSPPVPDIQTGGDSPLQADVAPLQPDWPL